MGNMENEHNTSNGVEPGKIAIVGNPCSYTDANQLKTRQFWTEVSSQPEKESNIPTIYFYLFDKNDADNKITIVSDVKEYGETENFAYNKSKCSFTIVSKEKEDGVTENFAFKKSKSSITKVCDVREDGITENFAFNKSTFSITIVSDEKEDRVIENFAFKKREYSITIVCDKREDGSSKDFAYNKGKSSITMVSDETENGTTGNCAFKNSKYSITIVSNERENEDTENFAHKKSKYSITIACDEKENGITENFAFKKSKLSVSLHDLYKGCFVHDGDATRSTSSAIDNSNNCNGRPESNISILAYGYGVRPNGNSPEEFQKNLENNRNYTKPEDRERVVKRVPSKESNYVVNSNVLYKVDIQRGETGSSASLDISTSSYCSQGSETNVTTCSWQQAGNNQYICPRNSEHNFDNVEYFNNINDIGFEKSGFESFLIFAILLKKFTVIIEAYSDCLTSKGNKSSKYGPTKFQLVVVSSELFEEAMRQCHIETVELTYTNVFPSDCRMFIGVPIYKYGYIHRKDQM